MRAEGRTTSVGGVLGMNRRGPLARASCSALAVLLLAGCGRAKADPAADILPGADAVAGWAPASGVEIFDVENIYDLVNGQADAFFAYGFEQVAVRHYEDADEAMLGVEVWRLATPADAYGLFTTSIAGMPVDIGNDGDGDPGWRLVFWQDRYYVQVRARREVTDSVLREFGDSVAGALASGGERPALVERLPADGLVERSAIYFHEEISFQSEIWLGSENLLGLGPETGGVVARYEFDGEAARLLLIQYPVAESASAGLAALEESHVDGLVIAKKGEDLLGAVFGEVEEAVAGRLLNQSLAGQ